MAPDFDVVIKGVESSRTAEDANENAEVAFNVNSSISESDSGPGFVTLKYSIDMETQPSAARIFVSGTARIAGKEDEIEQMLGAKEKDGTPTVFMRIYQRVYPTMYLLSGALHVPYPGPGLLKQNHMETEAQMVAQTTGRAERLGITR
jgi:hypothetical protein